MHTNASVLELIGKTPLLDISQLVPSGGAKLFAKLEMFNPGGSIKDRPACAMIEDAEKRGVLKPGMTIVEPTAGNTGIGLALVGNLKGYRVVFFVPDRMSEEKIIGMRLYGAEVNLIPKDRGMTGCIDEAKAFVEEHEGAVMLQQFVNPANPAQAQNGLAPEIGEQLGYIPDGLAIGAGTGGTFTGSARWLKGENPAAQCWLVQPVGSIFAGGPCGSYEIEGIGNSFIPANLDLDLADRIVDVADEESFAMVRQIAMKAGLLVGGSSAANVHAAALLAAELGSGKTVFTVMPDTLERYSSKDWVHRLVD